MLEITLATKFVPGTNVKGDVAGANWSYLLPNLELERVVSLGVPPAATLATLSRLGREVVVVCANERQLRQVREVIGRRGLDRIRPFTAHDWAALLLPTACADLVLIPQGDEARRLSRNRALLAELQRLLKPEGVIYFEPGLGGNVPDRFGEGFGAPLLFWLTPLSGEMQTAVSLGDRETVRYFLSQSLYSPSAGFPLFKRIERFLTKRRVFGQFTHRRGVILGRTTANTPSNAPPHYLRSIAQQAGVNIDHYSWGFSARGRFNSRKVLFFLFDRAGGSPEAPPAYIVKMTRDPALNARLANEYRALTLLHEKRLGDLETLPQTAFFGYHGGLAIVGETVINGLPFRTRTTATADCPYARAAIDWLVELGTATANSVAATPTQVASALEALFDQFVQIYQLTPGHRDFLAGQIAAIAGSREPFPLVFQHGDPGPWNVVVTPSGRVAFLDWEAAEPEGMPLWDLFYFMRSHTVWAARVRGVQSSLGTIAQQWLHESPLSAWVIASTQRYCERIGLPEHLLEPLFYTCWMHRALKEATRRAPHHLEDGHYVNLLRLCIEQREAPMLRQLFSLPTPSRHPSSVKGEQGVSLSVSV